MTDKFVETDWRDVQNGEERLKILRDRDLEVSSIAQGLYMRTRITNLELEVSELRALQDEWVGTRLSRLYLRIPRRIHSFFSRIFRV